MSLAGDRLSWQADGADWPNRAASRFVTAADLRWHVQVLGAGPVLLLLHGTAGATHSWRDLAPLLASRFTVVAPDLPGHGFTASPPAERQSISGMADAVAVLLATLGLRPVLVAGHSAGAAVLVQMCAEERVDPAALIAFNGALLPFAGAAAGLFTPLARGLARSAWAARLIARRAREPRAVQRLLRGTGSELDARGVELYARVAGDPGHVAAAVAMMAQWDLVALGRRFHRLTLPFHLVVAEGDRAVPPADARRLVRRLPDARVHRLPGLGHLAHEEDPAGTAALVERLAVEHGVLAARTPQEIPG